MSAQLALFAYGSFASNKVHFSLIENFVKQRESAVIVGSVYRLQVGYPVFVNDGNDQVPGEIFWIENESLWKFLDEFHGVVKTQPEKSLYFREQVQVVSVAGESHQVQVYAINPKKLSNTARRIPTGDWQADLSQQPALTSILSERQEEYLRKLGQSTGRDIVPIDLELYRQLMKLELIVDKGRRLALSKLGKEVYRYLG